MSLKNISLWSVATIEEQAREQIKDHRKLLDIYERIKDLPLQLPEAEMKLRHTHQTMMKNAIDHVVLRLKFYTSQHFSRHQSRLKVLGDLVACRCATARENDATLLLYYEITFLAMELVEKCQQPCFYFSEIGDTDHEAIEEIRKHMKRRYLEWEIYGVLTPLLKYIDCVAANPKCARQTEAPRITGSSIPAISSSAPMILFQPSGRRKTKCGGTDKQSCGKKWPFSVPVNTVTVQPLELPAEESELRALRDSFFNIARENIRLRLEAHSDDSISNVRQHLVLMEFFMARYHAMKEEDQVLQLYYEVVFAVMEELTDLTYVVIELIRARFDQDMFGEVRPRLWDGRNGEE
ncbi:hypothetical protein B0T21DRAFT_407406 [Apiosordaria backusii]|uniref:Uncharacterized protein n=1 Tax=Apiosordaria backusii TaxID=314023 RepID=A0AA40ERP8_9PEZI|nr:hypothetical protein B0T21DRAFT_407406 [Apiosordaria backusii]